MHSRSQALPHCRRNPLPSSHPPRFFPPTPLIFPPAHVAFLACPVWRQLLERPCIAAHPCRWNLPLAAFAKSPAVAATAATVANSPAAADADAGFPAAPPTKAAAVANPPAVAAAAALHAVVAAVTSASATASAASIVAAAAFAAAAAPVHAAVASVTPDPAAAAPFADAVMQSLLLLLRRWMAREQGQAQQQHQLHGQPSTQKPLIHDVGALV